jgi:Flp pilus assembly pilin Flp
MPLSLFPGLGRWLAAKLAPLRRDDGATTLEYVIIAAIVCVAAVIVATLIVAAINNYASQIPTG